MPHDTIVRQRWGGIERNRKKEIIQKIMDSHIFLSQISKMMEISEQLCQN